MNLRAGWQALWDKKVSAVGNLIALMGVGQPQFTPRDYENLARESYQRNVIAFSAMKEIARGAANVPFILFRRRGETRTEITNHALLDLLRRPNPLQGGTLFFEAVYTYFQISGNTYLEGVGPDGRPPRELWTQRPDRMRVIPGTFGLPSGYEFTVNGQKKIWDVDPVTGASPILHIKSFNPLNDWYGMGAIEAAAFSVDTHNKAGRMNVALLDNSARPSGAFVYKDDKDGNPREMSDPVFDRLKAQIDDQQIGVERAGKPLVLDGGVDYVQLGLSPKDMEFIEGKNLSAREIALVFGVPPQILGIPGDATYSNMKEARQSMWENTILPTIGVVVASLNNWLTPMFGSDLVLGIDEDRISALAPRREAVWERVGGADFLTDNEKRDSVDFGAAEGADEILKPVTLVPITALSSTTVDEGQKFLNLATREQRQREWRVQNNMINNFSKAAQNAFNVLLSRQARRSAEAFKTDGVNGVEISLKEHAANVERVLNAHHSTTMDAFGERILDAFKSVSGRREVKDRDSFFERGKMDWQGQHTARKVVLITTETRESILRAIREGEKLEESIAQISDRIVDKTGGVVAANRSLTIAQTETHAAAIAANDIAADATGLELKRRWLAALDAATRETHVAADGQIRDKTTPFDVGGAKLLRPGDPSGPPEETINCRCVVDFLTEEPS